MALEWKEAPDLFFNAYLLNRALRQPGVKEAFEERWKQLVADLSMDPMTGPPIMYLDAILTDVKD